MKKFNVILIVILGLLFWRPIFLPERILFSNDGPFGGAVAMKNRHPHSGVAMWNDLNYLGQQEPNVTNYTYGFQELCGHPEWLAALLVAVGYATWALGYRRALAGICLLQATACLGLLSACLLGVIDPYTSPWMSIYPVSLFLFPWLLLATMTAKWHSVAEPKPL